MVFGNNFGTYLWGRDIEDIKVHASRMISAHTMHERRMEYMQFIKCLEKSDRLRGNSRRLKCLQGLESLERLQRLESLERLEGLERLQRLQGLELDYQYVTIPDNSVVYCDPPYKGARRDAKYTAIAGEFSYGRFEDWLNTVDFPVFISELDAPRGCVPINFIDKVRSISSGTGRTVNEGLFLQERFLPWYEETIAAKEAI